MTPPPESLLHFPPFTLDARRFVLSRGGVPVDLSPRLVELLAYLATRPGELVTKDALLDRFWADVHVTENTVTRAIADIRKAIGDQAAAAQVIQTVARRGYRFVAVVSASETSLDPAHPALRETGDAFLDWVKGKLTLESLDASGLAGAVAAFEHAVDATPDYAPAHAGLANACFLQFERTRAQNAPDRGPLERAIAHARRASELDHVLGEAWATLGCLLSTAGLGDEARASARRAAALEPSSWRHQFRLGLTSWGEERLRAVDRTLSLLPEFAPAQFIAAMVFVARQAFRPALDAAARGAGIQARQAATGDHPFPAIGLHWLHGLLLLRAGEISRAIASFTQEIDEAVDSRIYGPEFRVNALVAAGHAHLTVDDPGGAAEAFRSALEILPRNGRALIGLYQTLSRTSFAADAGSLLTQVEHAIAELQGGGRLAEAALINAVLRAARDDVDGACRTLRRLLDSAPAGQVGWQIPIDPALAVIRSAPAFEPVLVQLAARAA